MESLVEVKAVSKVVSSTDHHNCSSACTICDVHLDGLIHTEMVLTAGPEVVRVCVCSDCATDHAAAVYAISSMKHADLKIAIPSRRPDQSMLTVSTIRQPSTQNQLTCMTCAQRIEGESTRATVETYGIRLNLPEFNPDVCMPCSRKTDILENIYRIRTYTPTGFRFFAKVSRMLFTATHLATDVFERRTHESTVFFETPTFYRLGENGPVDLLKAVPMTTVVSIQKGVAGPSIIPVAIVCVEQENVRARLIAVVKQVLTQEVSLGRLPGSDGVMKQTMLELLR